MKYCYIGLLSKEPVITEAFKNDNFDDCVIFGSEEVNALQAGLWIAENYGSDYWLKLWLHLFKIPADNVNLKEHSVSYSFDDYVTTYGGIKKISLPS